VQETLAEAARRLPDYLRQRPLPFYPWLRQLALERLIDLHRHHVRAGKRSVQREQGALPPLPDESAQARAQRLFGRGSSPSGHLQRREVAQRLQAALRQLSQRDREVLLRHLEGWRPGRGRCSPGVPACPGKPLPQPGLIPPQLRAGPSRQALGGLAGLAAHGTASTVLDRVFAALDAGVLRDTFQAPRVDWPNRMKQHGAAAGSARVVIRSSPPPNLGRRTAPARRTRTTVLSLVEWPPGDLRYTIFSTQP
jgi:hypothetical protein